MRGVKWQGRVEYDNIIRGRNLTLAQEKEKIAAWAKKYDRTEQVKKFRAEKDASFKKVEQQITKVLKSLPAAFKKYVKILKNGDKTMVDIKKAVRELYKKDRLVFRVLFDTLDNFKGWPRARPAYRRTRPYRIRIRRRRLAARDEKTKKNRTTASGSREQ
ncbi:hypothetical protein COOONC_22993 [Cooperia oncophora]